MSSSKIYSTLGFLFTNDLTHVALIEKKKPVFHAGKLNELGGKSEAGETPRHCIVREVWEETGVVTHEDDWVEVGLMTWDVWHVEMFATVLAPKMVTLQNSGDESVRWYAVDHLPEHVIENLQWLIPMCVDRLKNKSAFQIKVVYQ